MFDESWLEINLKVSKAIDSRYCIATALPCVDQRIENYEYRVLQYNRSPLDVFLTLL